MLFSKTKVFKSVVVFILAISMIGGLVVFKGFALGADAGDSFTISSVAEESPNADVNDVIEILPENAVDADATDDMETEDEATVGTNANDVMEILPENAVDADATDDMEIEDEATVGTNANDVIEILPENAVDADATDDMEIEDEATVGTNANDVMEILPENAADADATDDMEIEDEATVGTNANDVIEILAENAVDADETGIVEITDKEDNEEIYDNDVENTQENYVCLPGECPENPIIISSVEDLEDFATDLEEGNDFSGKYFEIIDDIIILKDNKFFSERLNKNGILFTGKFSGHIKSNKGGFIYIYVKEIPQKVFLFEDLGQDAEIYLGFVLLTEEEARVYSFSCS